MASATTFYIRAQVEKVILDWIPVIEY